MSQDAVAVDGTAEASEMDAVRVTEADERREIEAAEAKAGQETAMIPLSLITKSEASLRDVDRQDEEYQRLVTSVARRGVLNSILVRELYKDETTGITHYGLIDGLQRFTAAGDAGLAEIPARIVNMDDADILETQIITNMNRVVTKPAALSKHLLRILTRNPMLTKAQLAERVCQSESWLDQRLSLNKLAKPIQELVDADEINLTNAYALSKLPEEEQKEHVDAAMNESPKTFVGRMKARSKEIKDANKSGRDAGPAEFKPTQHLQKVADVKQEYAILVGDAEGDSAPLKVLTDNGIKVDDQTKKITTLLLAWALHYDPASQEAQRTRHEEQKKKREEQRQRLKQEAEEKKQQRAAEVAADLSKGF